MLVTAMDQVLGAFATWAPVPLLTRTCYMAGCGVVRLWRPCAASAMAQQRRVRGTLKHLQAGILLPVALAAGGSHR